MPRKERRRKKGMKGRKKKRIEAQMAKPRTPILEIYALIGDEEQAVKKKREQRKEKTKGREKRIK